MLPEKVFFRLSYIDVIKIPVFEVERLRRLITREKCGLLAVLRALLTYLLHGAKSFLRS